MTTAPAPRDEVFDGLTRDELAAAFALVKNPANWKLAINAVVPATADREVDQLGVRVLRRLPARVRPGR